MIFESHYWKEELYKNYLVIAHSKSSTNMSESDFFKIEKSIMLGAYIIRKLQEAQKIPTQLLKKNEEILTAKSNGKQVDLMNWHKIDQLYYLNFLTPICKKRREIINQIIHSYSFIISFDNNDLFDGFFINSDVSKTEYLFYISKVQIMRIFLSVSEGELTSYCREKIRYKEGSTTLGDFQITKSEYSYPDNFDLEKAIDNSLRGKIYRRKKNPKCTSPSNKNI